MSTYSLRKLADSTLRQDLKQLVGTDRSTTAKIVAHLAEFIARRLYIEDGYASMYDYCVGELKMSEDVACWRIRAARAVRRFPRIFGALADGRIHLTGIALLATHLTEENAEELLAASVHKSKREIQLLIAERFPQPDLPTFMASLGAACAQGHGPALTERDLGVFSQTGHSPVPVRVDVPTELPAPGRVDVPTEVAPQSAHPSVPARVDIPTPRVTPLAPERFAWQLTVSQETQDLLRQVQDLLGHEVSPADLEAVLKFSLLAAKQTLERRKFAATERPRAGHQRSNTDSRHVPAEVRRAVWQRDGGQCTFTSDTGHRCQERKDLQFDHLDPYAQGGEATIGGMRLLCRAHNQFEAERAYGAEFMRRKREQARARAAESRAAVEAETRTRAAASEAPARVETWSA